MLERDREQICLKNAKDHRRIPRELHDFLATAVFTSEPAEPRDHCSQQLQHDRRADIRHDAERENRAILQRAAAEQIKQRRHTAALLFRQ